MSQIGNQSKKPDTVLSARPSQPVKRIGVFVCHCGLNIAGVIDVKKVIEEIKNYEDVVHAEDYIYMCSDPGQDLVINTIQEKKLDGIVVANCSPTLHEVTFREAAARAGLNRYRVEIANIREHCSWPHPHQPERATRKAIGIIEIAIEKLKRDIPLVPVTVPITKRALVIGGGIAGIQAALDIADGGYEVILVEKSPSIGGKMIQLSETFPTLDCPQCIETPKMVSAGQHKNITIYAYSEVEEVKGYFGNFDVTIRRKASCVDNEKCNGCGDCMERCLTFVDSEFDLGLSTRKAIYTPFPQAVPNRPVIDKEHCGHFTTGLCSVCKSICPKDAIDYEQEDSFVTEKVGVIIVATGFELLSPGKLPEYGSGKIPDVVNGLQFERILCPSGPTYGEVIRPSDYTVPKEVVFIQCAGSRDPEHGLAYCSKVCCMYTGKQAMLYKHAVPDGQAYVFYMDVRSDGKGYEEFITRTQEEDGILYLRGRVSKLFRENGKVIVWGVDTLTGNKIEIESDMVVLATGVVPDKTAFDLAKKLRIAQDEYGWLKEAHLKLRPLETMSSGIYIAGFSQYPKDITDTVSQASGAASKVLALFSQDKVYHEPVIAEVDAEICKGCGNCERVCAYEAATVDPLKKIAIINEVLCEGCGACAAACPSGAMSHRNFSKRQLFNMISVATCDFETMQEKK